MKVSRKEIVGLIIGAIVGAAPFMWVWFSVGRGVNGFDASAMWGMPAIILAPFGGIAGAIIGVAATSHK